ncbi:MAG: hypothetical protein AMJ54_00585 [Deltaproteobacteria bacterium SG8_13]|nr:MAG: hypothetical protein AMJ54_00585 [Deltaproteobacteria bacterium SG8_13]
MDEMAGSITRAIEDSDDLETVKNGMPAYLLMVEGLAQDHPGDASLQKAAATLNGAYAGLFVEDPQRKRHMAQKALDYGFRAVCVRRPHICEVRGERFNEFAPALLVTDRADVPYLYALGTAWAGWIQAGSNDMNAIAQLPYVEAVINRVAELDETHDDGGVHVYLGVLATLLPPSMGGKPEVAREHFERAVALSNGENFMAKVIFAERYARLVFDRELHDRLLHEVLESDPHIPGRTLSNTYAQQRARELLASGEDYF